MKQNLIVDLVSHISCPSSAEVHRLFIGRVTWPDVSHDLLGQTTWCYCNRLLSCCCSSENFNHSLCSSNVWIVLLKSALMMRWVAVSFFKMDSNVTSCSYLAEPDFVQACVVSNLSVSAGFWGEPLLSCCSASPWTLQNRGAARRFSAGNPTASVRRTQATQVPPSFSLLTWRRAP